MRSAQFCDRCVAARIYRMISFKDTDFDCQMKQVIFEGKNVSLPPCNLQVSNRPPLKKFKILWKYWCSSTLFSFLSKMMWFTEYSFFRNNLKSRLVGLALPSFSSQVLTALLIISHISQLSHKVTQWHFHETENLNDADIDTKMLVLTALYWHQDWNTDIDTEILILTLKYWHWHQNTDTLMWNL